MINSDQIAVYGFSNLTDRMIKNGEVSTFSDKYEKLAGAELGQAGPSSAQAGIGL